MAKSFEKVPAYIGEHSITVDMDQWAVMYVLSTLSSILRVKMEESKLDLDFLPRAPAGYHWHMAWWDFREREPVWVLEKDDPVDEDGQPVRLIPGTYVEDAWVPPYGD